MLHSKEAVDQHVRILQDIVNSDKEFYIKCHSIAELYFNVKEFGKAKSFIDQYLVVDPNSVPGLNLKAQTHAALNENHLELECYEQLYSITKRNHYIIKVCQCLIQCDIDQRKAETWINILESVMPHNELLTKLKIRFCNDQSEGFRKLKMKMKNDANHRYKLRHLKTLAKTATVEVAFHNCLYIINNYDILDDEKVCNISLQIFQSYFKTHARQYNELFCLLLISALKTSFGSLSDESQNYISELYLLLESNRSDGVYAKLKAQFLYYLISYAHIEAIKSNQVNRKVSSNLYNGYRRLHCLEINGSSDHILPDHLYSWLNHQCSRTGSIVNHMLTNTGNSLKVCSYTRDWIYTIIDLVSPLNNIDCNTFEHMFDWSSVHNSPIDIKEMIAADIHCHSVECSDLNLIMYQFIDYIFMGSEKECGDFEVPLAGWDFLRSLLNALFPRLSLITSQKIGKLDMLIFLLGSALTFKAYIRCSTYQWPVPFELSKLQLELDSLAKWWRVACNHLSDKDVLAPIGYRGGLLKTGLNLVQLVDSSEIVKFQLGRCLSKFIPENESEEKAVSLRRFWFLFSAIKSSEVPSCKVVPSTSFSKQLLRSVSVTGIRPNNAGESALLFETLNVDDDTLARWRFEALRYCIERELSLGDLSNDLNDVEDLVDLATRNKFVHPTIYLLKSRMYLSHATKCQDVELYRKLINCASSEINSCGRFLRTLNEDDQKKLGLSVTEQRAAIADCKDRQHHVVDQFEAPTCTNNNQRGDNIPRRPSLSDDQIISGNVDGQLMVSLHKKVDTCLENSKEIAAGARSDLHDIRLLKMESKRHDILHHNLAQKVEHLVRRCNELSNIREDCQNIIRKNIFLENQILTLSNTFSTVSQKNLSLEHKLGQVELTLEDIVAKRIKESINNSFEKLHNTVSVELQAVGVIIKRNSTSIGELQSIAKYFRKKEKIRVKTTQAYKTIDDNMSNSEWKCCFCEKLNDKDLSMCSTCHTYKPMHSHEESGSDLIFVSQGPYVTHDQIERARELKLPDHFYHFENLPGFDDEDSVSSEFRRDNENSSNGDEEIHSSFEDRPGAADISCDRISRNRVDDVLHINEGFFSNWECRGCFTYNESHIKKCGVCKESRFTGHHRDDRSLPGERVTDLPANQYCDRDEDSESEDINDESHVTLNQMKEPGN